MKRTDEILCYVVVNPIDLYGERRSVFIRGRAFCERCGAYRKCFPHMYMHIYILIYIIKF